MNDYHSQFKSVSNTKLLEVLDKREEFHPEAVEAVKAELAHRQLSDKNLELAAEKLARNKATTSQRLRYNYPLLGSVLDKIGDILYLYHPTSQQAPAPRNYIRLIAGLFLVISAYSLIKELHLIYFMFSEYGEGIDFATLIFLLPLMLLPVSALLFWYEKKAGWVLMVFFMTYSIFTLLERILWTYSFNSVSDGITQLIGELFPQPALITFLLGFVFYGGVLWVLCKPEIRALFRVTVEMKRTIVLTSIIGLMKLVNVIFM